MTDSTKPRPDADRIAESISRRISECKWEIEQYDHICNMHVAGSEQYDTAWQAKQVTLAELSRLRNEQPKGGDGRICHPTDPHCQWPDCKDKCRPTATSPGPQDVRDIARKYAAVIAKEANELGALIGDDLISPIASEIGNAIREAVFAQQAPDAAQPVGLEVEETAAYALSEAKAETNELISLIRQGVWSSVKDEMISLTIEDDSDPSVGMVGARYLALPEGYDIWPTDTTSLRLDAVREALLEDGIRNLCYTAFQRRTSGRNSDDGGECDWMNDTLPIIERGIKNLLACTPAPSANEIERLTKERDEARVDAARLYEEGMDIVERWKRLLFDTCPQIIANKEAVESALAKANARIAELEASERPAPFASTGLIEAAELAEREASSYEATANNSFVQDEKDQYRGKARVLERFAEKLRTRAANRSAPSDDGSGAGS